MKKIFIVMLCAAAGILSAKNGGLFEPPAKKLIAFGWDNPTVEEFHKNIHIMEKDAPFFRGAGINLDRTVQVNGKQVTCTSASMSGQIKWQAEWFNEDIKALSRTRSKIFTDNFIRTSFGNGISWFDDAAWETLCSNYAIVARIARHGGLKGFSFDTEHYGKIHQFQYKGTVQDYRKTWEKARQRGAQFMKAVGDEYPDITILTFLLYSSMQRYTDNFGRTFDTARGGNYCLAIPFLNGMLDTIPPNARIVEGNEDLGYRAAKKSDFDNIYARCRRLIRNSASPENQKKVRAQVEIANAVYLDAFFSWPKGHTYALYVGHPGQLEYLSRIVRYALDSTDEYVWIWSECGRWWPSKMRKAQADRIRYYHNRPERWTEAFPDVDKALMMAADPIACADKAIAEGKLKNLAPNADFSKVNENGTPVHWGIWQHPAQKKSARVARVAKGDGGMMVLEVSKSPVMTAVMTNIPCRSGERFLLRGRSKCIGKASARFKVNWGIKNNKPMKLELCVAAITPQKDGWDQHELIVEVPENYDTLCIELFNVTDGSGTVLWDKVEAYRTEVWPGDIQKNTHPKYASPMFKAIRSIRDFKIVNDRVSGIIFDKDPCFVTSKDFSVNAGKCKRIKFTFKAGNPKRDYLQIFWIHKGEGYSEKNSISVWIDPNTPEREYVLDLSRNSNWKGEIIGLRIDPMANSKANPAYSFTLSHFRVE